MWESDTLTVSPAACEIAQRLLSGAETWLCPPQWYRALTAHLLPGAQPDLATQVLNRFWIGQRWLGDKALMEPDATLRTPSGLI